MTDKYNRISNFDPGTGKLLIAGTNGINRSTLNNDLNNLAPRLGFAYAMPERKLVIRGGYGIFYDLIQLNTLNAVRANIPFTTFANYAVDNPTQKVPPARIEDVFGPATAAVPTLPSLSIIDTNLRVGYVQHASLTVERQIAGNIVAELGFVRDKLSKFTAGRDVNAPLQRGTFIRPFPQFQGLSQVANIQDGNYNALLAKLEKRFSQGLSFLASYTYAKAIDNTSIGSAVLSASGSANGFQNPYCFSCNRGRSDFDNRQRFVFSGIYVMPALTSLNSALRAVLGAWQLSGILSLQSGMPVTSRVAGDNSLSRGGGDRPNRVEGTPVFGPSTHDPAHWFNPAAFVVPPRGEFGQVGRNVFDGPGISNLDLGIFKNFPIKEDIRLQFRSELFNVANHPNFAWPNTSINTPTAGIITSTNTPSRQIQFALKLLF